MDFDPVNRDVPAPRYELESGSEDELEHNLDAKDRKVEAQDPFSIVSCGGSADASTLEHNTQLLVLVGNAGAAFLSSLGGAVPMQQFSLQTKAEQHAAIAVVDSGRGKKITAALVAPPPQLRSWRFHEIAQTLIEATCPSSIVILDSYSPQEQLYRDPSSEDHDEQMDTPVRYLATPHYLATNQVDATRLIPLRSPEAATGLGAAFLSRAVMDEIPAILALLEDVSFQSHIQLYGSLGPARLSPSISEILSSLTGLNGKGLSLRADTESSILNFVASRRIKPAANLAMLGDGNMYI